MDQSTPVPEGYYDPNAPQETIEHKPPSSLPVLAGIFLILAGLSGFLTWSQLLASDVTLFQNYLPANYTITAQQLQSFLQVCSIFGIVFSALAFVGGLMAFRRRSWGLAIAGSILGILTIGIFFSASLFSFLGLILLIISRKEFSNTMPT
jgi:hypothetical protein